MLKRAVMITLLLVSLVALNGCFIDQFTTKAVAEKFWTGWRDSNIDTVDATIASNATFADETGIMTSPPTNRAGIVDLFGTPDYWWFPNSTSDQKSMVLTANGTDETLGLSFYVMDVYYGSTTEPYVTVELAIGGSTITPKITHIAVTGGLGM